MEREAIVCLERIAVEDSRLCSMRRAVGNRMRRGGEGGKEREGNVEYVYVFSDQCMTQ
jgi:hypothetical protein